MRGVRGAIQRHLRRYLVFRELFIGTALIAVTWVIMSLLAQGDMKDGDIFGLIIGSLILGDLVALLLGSGVAKFLLEGIPYWRNASRYVDREQAKKAAERRLE